MGAGARAAEFPAVIFTSALLVAGFFWLRVLVGRAGVRDFDADAPKLARALGGVPVAVAASVLIVSAWLVSFAGIALIGLVGLTGLGGAAARLALLVSGLLLGWLVTRCLTGPLARLFPDEPGPHPRDLESGEPFDPGSRSAPRLN